MNNLPQSKGYYWAKVNSIKWYNAIIKVYGDFPFFRVEGWDFCNDRKITSISDIDEFGGEIEEMK